MRHALASAFLLLAASSGQATRGLALPHSSVTPAPDTSRAAYPAHWWAPVPEEGAPEWEILPQQAGPGEVILSKRNELGSLSNCTTG